MDNAIALTGSSTPIGDAVGEAVIATDLRDRVIYWNDAAQQLFGYKRAEAIGRRVLSLIVPLPAQRDARIAVRALGTSSWSGEFVAAHRDGRTFPCRVSDRPLLDGRGRLVGRVGVCSDVTAEAALREELAQKAALFRGVFDESPVAKVVIDADQRVIRANQAMLALLDASPDHVIGRMALELAHPDDRAQVLQAAMTWLQGRTARNNAELRLVKDAGTVIDTKITAYLVTVVAGEVHCVIEIEDRSEVVRVQRQAEEHRDRLELAMESAGVAAWDADLLTGEIVVSENFERIFNLQAPRNFEETAAVLVPEDRALLDRLVQDADPTFHGVVRIRDADDAIRHVSTSGTRVRNKQGRIVAVRGVLRDLTAEQLAQEQREHVELVSEAVIETSVDAFVGISSNGRIDAWNAAAEKLFGWHRDEVIGHRLASIIIPARFRWAHASAVQALNASNPSTGVVLHREIVAITRDRREIPVELQVTAVVSGGKTSYKAFIRDLTERRAYEQTLALQAATDPLTGLPNRGVLVDRLDDALTHMRVRGGRVAVFFIDIDRFKVVNDSLGHAVGDRLLVEVAMRFSSILGPGETLARFGGDEFVIVLDSWRGDQSAAELVSRLHRALEEDVKVDDRTLSVDVSIGVAITDSPDTGADELIRDADVAMYQAKARPGTRWALFDDKLRIEAVRRLELERELRNAIDTGGLEVHYQPVVSMRQRLVSLEALVRWRHDERGLVGPAEFISLAEETGLISTIGDQVNEAACRQLASWHRRFPSSRGVVMSINLSGRQLIDLGLPGRVEELLSRYGIEPAEICFEITESVLMDEGGAAIESLHALRRLGVQLAIDDFGTGFASMLSLRRLPVQILKLDRSFVRGLGSDPRDTAIVRTGIDLAHSLGMRAIAEGVECAEHVEQLTALGCDQAQGYLWSPPLPADRIESWFETRRARSA